MSVYEEFFRSRVAQLRSDRKVSARDMSLTLGQSESYINKIENGKAFPSMQVFFYICEYFGITPQEFFDDGTRHPAAVQAIVDDLGGLDERQLASIAEIVRGLRGKK